MPGLKVDVVDSTGAGDIFHGAFTYGLINGFSIEKCVAFANIAGGLSCTKMGGDFQCQV
jgi:Sugar kinases, ribokinase family